MNGAVSTTSILLVWLSECLRIIDLLSLEAYLALNPGQAGSGYNSSDAWDYFHINSVDKDDQGNYLISARDVNSVYKINGETGEIIWQLGGKSGNFDLGKGVIFAFQHDARFHARTEDGTKEVISLYDNSAHGTENGRGKEVHFNKHSSGKIIEVDTKTGRATLVQAFNPPDDLLSKSQGSTQLLPNGNAFVNWGSEGAVTEFKSDGTPIFHAYLDSGLLAEGVENYRGYRYNWTGVPNETPAIVALNNGKETTVYVSWNGDTRTQLWRFYEVAGDRRSYLGETKRLSFETELKVKRHVTAVFAEAIDANGAVLVSTVGVKEEAEIRQYSSKKQGTSRSSLLEWLTFRGQKFFKSQEL